MAATAQAFEDFQTVTVGDDRIDERFWARVRAGEAVCEAWPLRDGEAIDAQRQCARFERLLRDCAIAAPMGHELILEAIAEAAQRDGYPDGVAILRIERGAPGEPGVLQIAVRST